jgi:uncharacterized membrane-anchored protein
MTTAFRSTTRISLIAILALLLSIVTVPTASARQAPSAEDQMSALINAERAGPASRPCRPTACSSASRGTGR